MQLSHTAAAMSATFDDPNLVSTAGLVPTLRLAQNIGLHTLADSRLSGPTGKGAKPGAKITSLLAVMIVGADSIDDMNLLRHGGTGKLFARRHATSTLGSVLRAVTFGHVRQLDAIASRALARLSTHEPLITPGADPNVFVDVDDKSSRSTAIRNRATGVGAPGYVGPTRPHLLLTAHRSSLLGACAKAPSGRHARRLIGALSAAARLDGTGGTRGW